MNVKIQMDDFFKKLRFVHKPTKEKPWLELEYGDAESLDKFVNFINTMNNIIRLNPYNHPFLFRGQSDAKWSLMPKIVRLFKKFPKITIEDALRIEFDSFQFFRQQAHIYLKPEIIPNSDVLSENVEWISLMQHYSAPTRMLDWSTSFNVALYFAVTDEPLEQNGAMWLFQKEPVETWMENKYPYPQEVQQEEYRKKVLTNCREYINFGKNHALPKIVIFDKQRKFERIVSQGSIFTYSDQLFVDHALLIGNALFDNLQNGTLPKNILLTKILISPEAKKYFRRHLSKLNITASSLFPGIDGIGRAISEITRVECETFLKSQI